MADTVYQLSDVVKRYRKGRGEVLALRGVDLVIRDGEWLAIQGPTGNLDEGTRDEIIALLEDLWRRRGLTMVLVTHDSAVAGRAPRLGLMRNGQFEDAP